MSHVEAISPDVVDILHRRQQCCPDDSHCSAHMIRIMILPSHGPCQYCACISNRILIGDEVPIQTSNMKQHPHQNMRHQIMIQLKSCTVLIGHVSCRIFTELLTHGRGRTISFRCYVLPTRLLSDAVPIDTAASQLMVSFPMIPELMDINSWLRGNG